MPIGGRGTVIVSPPTFDKSGFARVDAALAAAHAPLSRAWIMARYAEGLQIRMLKPPQSGLVLFQPGTLAWRPIGGIGRALVVHDLRVAPGPHARDGVARLWSVVEAFARYYGFGAVVGLIGTGPGLIAPDHAPGRGWIALDTGPGGLRLVGRVLHGPLVLPYLPTDWAGRAAALGHGIVIQTTGESPALEDRAERMVADLASAGARARHDRLADADRVRAQAVRPAAVYSVVVDGQLAGGPELTADAILKRARAWSTGQ